MKVLFYKFGGRMKFKRGSAAINFERALFLCFVIVFVLLILTQAALTNPNARTFLTGGPDIEGTPLGAEEFLYREGEIGLELLSPGANGEVKVLVNGDEAAVFNGSHVDVTVKDGDVLEVDASASQGDAEVEIVSKTDNITTGCVGLKVRADSGVKRLVRVKIK